MADLIGITKKALQRRREREAIPEGVWMKIDSRIVYSLRRYDEWLESRWVEPKLQATPKTKTSLSVKQPTGRNYILK